MSWQRSGTMKLYRATVLSRVSCRGLVGLNGGASEIRSSRAGAARAGPAARLVSAEEATRARQRQWCCASTQVAPAGQSPGSALHTSVRTGAPFARRSTTLRPQGPGVWSVRQLPHVGDTEVVEGFRPSSTQAVRA